jgi:hypothetical protein
LVSGKVNAVAADSDAVTAFSPVKRTIVNQKVENSSLEMNDRMGFISEASDKMLRLASYQSDHLKFFEWL